MAGTLFFGSGCGTLFQREDGRAPIVFAEAIDEAQPVAEAPVAEPSPPPVVVESAPTEGGEAPAARPWYKPFGRKRPAPVEAPDVTAPAPVEAAPVAPAAPAVAPVPEVKTAPVADPVPAAATNEPAGRRWYQFWGPGAPRALPAVREGGEAEAPAKAVPAVAESVSAAETNPPAAKPWYRFWGRPASAGSGDAGAKPPELPSASGMFSAIGEPLVKPGYSLRMSVSAGGKMEMAEQVKTVSDKGDITLPLIGTVVCEGKTVQELADELEKLYTQYIRDPQASVEFVYTDRPGEISPWGAVGVYGFVRNPGRVNIPPTRDLTVSRAIQSSGGAREDAKQSAIVVTRRSQDGSKRQIKVDLDAAAKRGESEKDIVLEHGDMVFVPQSTW